MKQLICLLALLGLSLAARAQEDPAVVAQRSRIKAERTQAEAIFKTEEKACWAKFSVNDCLASAKAKRREVLADLHRQEVSLNDAERKRKAAQRQRTLEERNLAERQREEAEQAGKAAQVQSRETRAADKAAARASQESAAPGKAARREQQAEQKKARQAAAEAHQAELSKTKEEQHDKRVAEAEERKEKLKQRLAESKKPAAKPLPVPP